MTISARPSLGATGVSLSDTSQTTTFQAIISEQINVVVPSNVSFGNITFNGNNSSVAVKSQPQTVRITGVTLSKGNTVKVSLEANSANFTNSTGPTFAAGDVSWAESTWTLGTGVVGTLTNTAFTDVARSVANPVGTVGTTNLVFTLGSHNFAATAVQSGSQTLIATWKFQSF